MPFYIVRNDITAMDTDAVVNAANSALAAGGGVCGAIFDAAGHDKLKAECDKIGHCDTGKAVITDGCDLKAKYIIHAVGPVYRGGGYGEEELLYSCYRSSLNLAKKYKLKSIAFPLISAGIYGYPKAEALQVAKRAVTDFLTEEDSDIEVSLVVYDKNSFEVSRTLFDDVCSFIEDCEIHIYERQQRCEIPYMNSYSSYALVQEMFDETDISFSEYLIQLIDKSGMTDSEVYHRANRDRRLFSKIRGNRDYQPSKETAVAFAIALRLSFNETQELLRKAGYVLTRSNKSDIIVEYFIRHRNYDIFAINEMLFEYDRKLL